MYIVGKFKLKRDTHMYMYIRKDYIHDECFLNLTLKVGYF